jgi:acetyltransferase-like isoleucine patch superfamily enzyme
MGGSTGTVLGSGRRGREVVVHPTALVESGVSLGDFSRVWDNAHIRRDARLGRHVTVGEKTYIAYGVEIGDNVKINAFVYICAGVTIEDMCMISAGVVFTNDRFPRAMNRELTALETSDPTEETLHTRVCQGATIGANATIGPGITLGAFSMIGMGSVVTRDVPGQALVFGNPARRRPPERQSPASAAAVRTPGTARDWPGSSPFENRDHRRRHARDDTRISARPGPPGRHHSRIGAASGRLGHLARLRALHLGQVLSRHSQAG